MNPRSEERTMRGIKALKHRARITTATVAVIALVLAGCTGDVQETPEYREVEEELDSVSAEVTELADDIADLEAQLAEQEQTTLLAEQDHQDALTVLEQDIEDQASRADRAEEALHAELNKPWPAALKDPFVEECAAEPAPDLDLEQTQSVCSCMVDQFEQQMSLEDFMVMSIEAAYVDDPDDINPITGLPKGTPSDLVEVFATATITCFMSVEA